MSIAGIRSNRGDVYQTLIAFDWALTVLSDHNFQWFEIDSITYSVDDVVVGKTDGTWIACQCKKNQTDFKAWTIADLADELDKACHLLANNQNVKVRFYSRNNFGDLAKLREHSSTQHDEISYQASLGKEHKVVDKNLSDRLAAFAALWFSLGQLGARIAGCSASAASQHRLTKGDLKTIIQKAGATLVPPMCLMFSDRLALTVRGHGLGRFPYSDALRPHRRS